MPACLPPFSPDADVLILVCQVLATQEVVCLDRSNVRSKEVLGAAFGGKVVVTTRVLGHLEGR